MSTKKLSDEELAVLVANCTSMYGLLSSLGLRHTGGSSHHYGNRIREAGIDKSHWCRIAWNKGKTSSKKKTASDILVILPEGSRRPKREQLVRALLEVGTPYDCNTENCPVKGGKWLGKDVILYVDHIDGNWLNNQLDNLRFLCYNCHVQTETFAGKNFSQMDL